MNEIDSLRNELEENLRKKFGFYCFSSMKWQSDDHFENFSDIDLRIVIDTNSERDVIMVDEAV